MDSPKETISQTENIENIDKRKGSFESVTREAIGGDSAADLPPHYYRSPRFIGTFISFILSYQGGFLGYVMPANVITLINADIGPSPNYIWVILVFTLTQTVTFTVVGRLADLFGRRYFFIGGSSMALIGYIVSSRANTINMLIGASVLSGIGSAIQITACVIGGELVANRHRFMAYGIIAATLAPLSSIAPGLARTMTVNTSQGWRWIYYLVSIITALALILQMLFYHPPRFDLLHQGSSKRETVKGLDYVGLFLFTGSAVTFLLGISWGGQKYPWHSTQVIVTLVVGGVAMVGFFIYEGYSGISHPLIPLFLFKDRNYVAFGLIAGIGSMVFFSLNIIWGQQISLIFGESPTATGWISCTLTAGEVLGIVSGTVLIHKLQNIKWQLIVVLIIFTGTIGGMSAVDSSKKGMAITLSIISSAMIGYFSDVCLAAGPLMLDSKYLGLASGVQFSVRTGMATLAESIYVTILENQLTSNVPKYVVPAALKAGLPPTSLVPLLAALTAGNTTAVEAVPGISTAILGAVEASFQTVYYKSFQVVYFVSIAFGVCAIIAAFCIDHEGIESKLTSGVARKIQGTRGEEIVNNA